MSAVEQIVAALDEAEAKIDRAIVPWRQVLHRVLDDANVEVADLSVQFDAHLIVAVVNRERAHIKHARDVLARHVECNGALDPKEMDSRCTYCVACYWPCAEVLSVAAAWVTP